MYITQSGNPQDLPCKEGTGSAMNCNIVTAFQEDYKTLCILKDYNNRYCKEGHSDKP
jgi:hypothetical protein